MKSAPAIVNVRPKKSIALGSGEKVMSFETMCVRANAMFSVPSVTMNAGSRTTVDQTAVQHAEADARERCRAAIAGTAGTPLATAQLGHHDLAERHHRAARQVDARGQDHERLADRQHADDHHLLEDQRQVLRLQEPVGLQREERHRQRSARAAARPSAPSSTGASTRHGRRVLVSLARVRRRPSTRSRRSSQATCVPAATGAQRGTGAPVAARRFAV